MTVDSRYFPVTKVRDSDTVYTFDIESIGDDAMEVYVIVNGVRTEVPYGFFDAADPTALKVYFEYEEHLDPIKKRGRAVLSRSLNAGESLSIERRTPITQTIDFASKELLDPNQIEYALDKICFIEQEIEGHFCDCRGTTWETGTGATTPPEIDIEDFDPLPPECVPYSCSALITTLEGWVQFIAPSPAPDVDAYFSPALGFPPFSFTRHGTQTNPVPPPSWVNIKWIDVETLVTLDERQPYDTCVPNADQVLQLNNTLGGYSFFARVDQPDTINHSGAAIFGPNDRVFTIGSGVPSLEMNILLYTAGFEIISTYPVGSPQSIDRFARLELEWDDVAEELNVYVHNQEDGIQNRVLVSTLPMDADFYENDFHTVVWNVEVGQSYVESIPSPVDWTAAFVDVINRISIRYKNAGVWLDYDAEFVTTHRGNTHPPPNQPAEASVGQSNYLEVIGLEGINYVTMPGLLIRSGDDPFLIQQVWTAWQRNRLSYEIPETCP